MTETQAMEEPCVGPRGIAALRSTRRWALWVGIVALAAAVLAVINTFAYVLVFPSELPANVPPYFVALIRGMAIVSAIVALVGYGLSGWFALQYGRGLGASLRGADAARLEAALWWQRRYWTLQGALIIVMIVVVVLIVIAAAIVGVNMAAHDAAWLA